MGRLTRLWVVGLLAATGFAVACASDGGRDSAPASAPPPGTPLAQIQIGQTDYDVHQILGEPSTTSSHQTGKAWIPYYYGPDTSRLDWIYQGMGRVVFSRNRYSGDLAVVDVVYNPNELR